MIRQIQTLLWLPQTRGRRSSVASCPTSVSVNLQGRGERRQFPFSSLCLLFFLFLFLFFFFFFFKSAVLPPSTGVEELNASHTHLILTDSLKMGLASVGSELLLRHRCACAYVCAQRPPTAGTPLSRAGAGIS